MKLRLGTWVGLVGAAMIRLEGGNPSLGDGINIAKSRIGAILGYAAIAATVGMILQSLKNRDNNFLVRMLGSGLGAAWTLATFLVVPVLVSENVGPIDALKQSVALLKRTWGENAIGTVGIGLAFGLLTAVVAGVGLLLAYAAAQLSWAMALLVAGVFVAAIALMAVYQAALSGVYSAALYRYASAGEVSPGFEFAQIEQAFAPKAA